MAADTVANSLADGASGGADIGTADAAASQALLRARFGIDLPGTSVPDAVAGLLDRRVTRRYTEQEVPDSLLDALLAAAQSAPAKSGLQQFSGVGIGGTHGL